MLFQTEQRRVMAALDGLQFHSNTSTVPQQVANSEAFNKQLNSQGVYAFKVRRSGFGLRQGGGQHSNNMEGC